MVNMQADTKDTLSQVYSLYNTLDGLQQKQQPCTVGSTTHVRLNARTVTRGRGEKGSAVAPHAASAAQQTRRKEAQLTVWTTNPKQPLK